MAPAYRPPAIHQARFARGARYGDTRDPANELYGRACDLLGAAQGLRRAAAVPGSCTGIAATLGCVEAALDALSGAVADMGRQASTQTGGPPATHDRFERLRLDLSAAQATCGAARERVGPLLADGPDEAA